MADGALSSFSSTLDELLGPERDGKRRLSETLEAITQKVRIWPEYVAWNQALKVREAKEASPEMENDTATAAYRKFQDRLRAEGISDENIWPFHDYIIRRRPELENAASRAAG